MSLLALSGTNSVSGGYEIDNSLKLEADNSEYLNRTPSSNTNRQTFTFSTWIKRTELGGINAILEAYQDGTNFFVLGIQNSDELVIYNIDSGTDYGYVYTKLFRDTAAWYHIVFKSDTTNGTAANRWQVYVNGVEITTKSSDYGTPPQNYNSNLNSTISHNIGKREDQGTFMSCYLAETHLVDGTALAPTAFGEFDEDSGIWKPKAYTGSYGTNGFYLDFENASSLGADSSGNGNNFTPTNITSADQAQDSPTNIFSNLEVGRNPAATFLTFNEGNTKLTYAGSTTAYDSDGSGISNFRVNTSGKWYMEFSFAGDGDRAVVGVVSDQGANHAADTDYTRYIMYRGNDGAVIYNTNGSDVSVSGAGPTYDSPDIIGIALDCDNERVSFSKNGNWIDGSGSSASNSSPTYYVDWTGHDFLTNSTGNGNCVFLCTNYVNGGTPVIESNFGGYTTNSISSGNSDSSGYGNFEYAPPSGYYALCSRNLSEYG